MRQWALIGILIIAAVGCGPSVADRQAAYKTAKDVLAREREELAALTERRRAIEADVAKEMRDGLRLNFEINNPRPELLDSPEPDSRNTDPFNVLQKDSKSRSDAHEDALSKWREKERVSMRERALITAEGSPHFAEFKSRSAAAAKEVMALIDEQQARLERAERMLKDAEAALPK